MISIFYIQNLFSYHRTIIIRNFELCFNEIHLWSLKSLIKKFKKQNQKTNKSNAVISTTKTSTNLHRESRLGIFSSYH